MRIDPGWRRSEGDPSLPLVNVVFLLLVFVVLAGRMAMPDERAVRLPETANGIAVAAGARTLVLPRNGAPGDDDAIAAFVAEIAGEIGRAPGEAVVVTVFADREADAGTVLAIAERLQAAGADRVELATVASGRADAEGTAGDR